MKHPLKLAPKILSLFGPLLCTLAATLAAILIPTKKANSADFVVYSVYKELDMGNPDEIPQKDFYVNLGSAQGVKPGSKLEVLRRISSYDLQTEKLYKEVTFPIAHLKIIHVESNAAIARLDKMLAADKTPAMTPRAVMIGDLVRPAN
jgi:hypothetical protein